MADLVLFSSRKRRKTVGGYQTATTGARIAHDVVQPSATSVVNTTAAGQPGRQTAVPASSSKQDSAGEQPVATEQNATTFAELGLNAWMLGVLKTLDINVPTGGRCCIGVSHTGSGKTAAFALPILQQLAANPFGVFALVLTPTRELALQIQEQFRAFGSGMQLRDCCCIGGLNMQQQGRELQCRPHVVVATPGRLASLFDINPELAQGFKRLQVLVLDEADRMLDDTFAPQLQLILQQLPQKRQTLLFSATMTQNLLRLQQAAMKDAHVFEAYQGLTTAEHLVQQYIFIPDKVKDVYLFHILSKLEDMKVRSAIVFVGTCKGCHLMGLLLDELDIRCATLHSRKPQAQRFASLQRFKAGAVPLLLATDVASRGLDIPTVDLVINYDLPMLARDYVHRVGRTARAGRGGRSVSLVTQYDIERVHQIEGLTKVKMEELATEEAEVLKPLTRVYAARRAAGLRMIDEEAAGKNFKPAPVKKAARQDRDV